MLNGLLWVVVAGGLLPLGGRLWWVLELFTHFRLQYLALALPFLAVALWQRWPVTSIALFAIMTVNAWPVLPDLPFGKAAEPGSEIVVLNINVQADNPEHDRVLERIRESGADVVTLIELSRPLAARLREA